jgi:hypothetical protein
MVQQVCGVQHPVQHLAALPPARNHRPPPESAIPRHYEIYLAILTNCVGDKFPATVDLTSGRTIFEKKYGPADFLASLVQNKSQKRNKLRE